MTKTEGTILRGKVRWHEGECNTKYCYSLEKRHHDIKTVSKLKVAENCYIEDQFAILEEEKKFYKSLYCSTYMNPKIFKNLPFFKPENVTTTLSEEEKRSCEGLANEEECTNALKDFNKNWSASWILPILLAWHLLWSASQLQLCFSGWYTFYKPKTRNNLAYPKIIQG